MDLHFDLGVTGELVMAAVAAAAGAVAFVSFLGGRRDRLRSRRRLARVVGELDASLGAIGRTLEAALQRIEHRPERGRHELALTIDLDEMLVQLAREAAARTGAEAAAVRVRGPADEPTIGSFGTREAAALLETTLRSAAGRPFRAVTINWTFPPEVEPEIEPFRSALVVPLVEDGVETGAIAGYATEPAAFRPEHARALEALAAEAAESVATARRFAAFRSGGRREHAAFDPSRVPGDAPA
jgi:GAF domain-containing protein